MSPCRAENDAYYNAPADYAGVSIRSTLTWPMPMDEIAVLNPKLALAMGQSKVPGGHREQRTGSPEPRGWKTKRSSRGVRIQDDERPERPDRSEHDGPG